MIKGAVSALGKQWSLTPLVQGSARQTHFQLGSMLGSDSRESCGSGDVLVKGSDFLGPCWVFCIDLNLLTTPQSIIPLSLARKGRRAGSKLLLPEANPGDGCHLTPTLCCPGTLPQEPLGPPLPRDGWPHPKGTQVHCPLPRQCIHSCLGGNNLNSVMVREGDQWPFPEGGFLEEGAC